MRFVFRSFSTNDSPSGALDGIEPGADFQISFHLQIGWQLEERIHSSDVNLTFLTVNRHFAQRQLRGEKERERGGMKEVSMAKLEEMEKYV